MPRRFQLRYCFDDFLASVRMKIIATSASTAATIAIRKYSALGGLPVPDGVPLGCAAATNCTIDICPSTIPFEKRGSCRRLLGALRNTRDEPPQQPSSIAQIDSA